MKSTFKLLLICLLFAAPSIQAQELKWYTNMEEASTIAVKKKKPLMLFFTGSDWCGWCIKLQKEVFQTPEFKSWAAKNVILVELDFPRRKTLDENIKTQNMNLQKLFNVRGYPTVWIVDVDKKNTANLERLGSTGYVAGGPAAWITGAEQIIANKKK
ncbi:thioredoxin family protein [Flavobacterium sp.]|uniref:thioredoxin family protein n=1 Tax=Flavobacterium sp. TaxID=239 RepID=UPI003B9C9C1D